MTSPETADPMPAVLKPLSEEICGWRAKTTIKPAMCSHGLNHWLNCKSPTDAKSGTKSNTYSSSHLMREARPTAQSTRANINIAPKIMTVGSIPVQRGEKNQ